MRLSETLRRYVGSDAGGAGDSATDSACRCTVSPVDGAGAGGERVTLHVDAADCPRGGDLAASPGCRASVVSALAARDADLVRVRDAGVDRVYDGRAAALLLAAGRFVDAAAFHDPELADRARRDPLAVAREATGRAGPVNRLAAETGLAACAADAAGYDDVLRATTTPAVALGRAAAEPPAASTLRDRTVLDTGATVRIYDVNDANDAGRVRPHYHVTPPSSGLDAAALSTLTDAYRALADGTVSSDGSGVQGRGSDGVRVAGRAVRAAAEDCDAAVPVETLTAVLAKHTRGIGVIEDLFADGRLTDAYLTAPVDSAPVRVVVAGEAMTTNVRLTAAEAETLASRVRAASGRSFSRAAPTTDAALPTISDRFSDAGGGSAAGAVRVAGVTAPASDGPGFAFRRRDDEPWTLPRLVAAGSLPARAAALLWLAAERGAAGLVAGPRGAGKTTTLAACCWAIPPAARTVVVEDTPELPVAAMCDAGRDVQSLHVGTDDDAALTPTDAVRAALRLGDGALVVGEVRGAEARALYEAMRVGAAADAVLGTIHGTGAAAVRERVVSDLGVPASSFAATDFVATLGADHRLDAVEEVRATGTGAAADSRFVSLFSRGDADPGGAAAGRDGDAADTGVIDRGDSALLSGLAAPDETYRDVRDALNESAERIQALADDGRTGRAAVASGLGEP